MTELLQAIRGARIYDLGQPYFTGMPHHPAHPPYLFALTKKHGDYVAQGVSSAADGLALGSHVGTHIDALCHFSLNGRLHGGEDAAEAQSYASGLQKLSVDTIAPILRRGVLLDIAGIYGDPLPADFVIAPEHLDQAAAAEKVSIEKGDVVLLRTGWARYWDDAARFISQVRGPGPGEPGARWLSERGVFAAGSDTAAFESVPAPAMPVHIHLLVAGGIHIIECLNLERLAADRVHTFVFVAIPLKIRGGTASPIRPVALA